MNLCVLWLSPRRLEERLWKGTRKNPQNAQGGKIILENITGLQDGHVLELGFLRVPEAGREVYPVIMTNGTLAMDMVGITLDKSC